MFSKASVQNTQPFILTESEGLASPLRQNGATVQVGPGKRGNRPSRY